ncbi:hypothetical protein A2223_02395 [Candidatus Falkowbacteria bacterium RIFOXYA2_FULL_35_8]|nr:MAG: hypothetical protein A2223_02395 [Candidatus Falkowbacteria bacterium RIFOXYA2_FULL_35_8]
MDIRLATIADKNSWDEFIANQKLGAFTQSWIWAEFMATQKEKIYRLIVTDNNQWSAVCFLFVSKLKGGFRILYAPKGPIIADDADIEKNFEFIMKKIDQIAVQEKAIYFQCDPETNDTDFQQIYDQLELNKSEFDIQPRHTLILNIQDSEENLLNQMHSKTRYNIRLAQKKDVSIEIDNSKFKQFNELLKLTTDRQHITLFGEKYFKQLLSLPFVKLYLAKYDGQYIAANIMIFWNHTATYLYGASDYKFRPVMAPYLLQWQAIKDAKDQNIWSYDFWGAAPQNITGHEEKWFGFTKFKMGFSPEAEITEYLGTYEKIYNPTKLGIYRFLRKFIKK